MANSFRVRLEAATSDHRGGKLLGAGYGMVVVVRVGQRGCEVEFGYLVSVLPGLRECICQVTGRRFGTYPR